MLARLQQPGNDPSLSKAVNQARKSLSLKGWSYRTAAPELGVHWTHLAKVLTGRRVSARLLSAIHDLPDREQAA